MLNMLLDFLLLLCLNFMDGMLIPLPFTFILPHPRNELNMLTGPGGTSSLLLVVTSPSLLLILSHRVIWTRKRLLPLHGRLELYSELSKTRSSLRKKSELATSS